MNHAGHGGPVRIHHHTQTDDSYSGHSSGITSLPADMLADLEQQILDDVGDRWNWALVAQFTMKSAERLLLRAAH